MAYYTIYKDFKINIEAKNKDDAIQKVNSIPFEEWEETYTSIDECLNIEIYHKMLDVLEKFHGSECEKEWLKVKDAFDNKKHYEFLRVYADFIEKGEYKKYNGVIATEDYHYSAPSLSLKVEGTDEDGEVYGETRYYHLHNRYDIEDDIERLKRKIAEYEADHFIKEKSMTEYNFYTCIGTCGRN